MRPDPEAGKDTRTGDVQFALTSASMRPDPEAGKDNGPGRRRSRRSWSFNEARP